MNTKKDTKKTRTENTVRNIVAGVINKILVLLLPFLVRTVLIQRLGADYVGISSLYSSILQVLNVTELGFSSAIIYSMYEPVAKNDIPEIKSKIRLFYTIYKLVGTIILIGGIIALPFLPKLIDGEAPSDVNIYLAFIIFLANTVISYFTYGYKNSVLTVYQRDDLISKTNSFITIVKCLIQILVLILFRNFYVYAVIIPVTTLLGNLILNHLSNRLHPELNDKYKFSLSGLKGIRKQIGGIAIGRISLVCRNSFDSIILSSLFGLNLTAIYSNYYFVFSSIGGFMSILITSMSASVGNSLVTESVEKNERDHRKFDFYYEAITGFCVMCLYSLYQSFMNVWVGESLMLPRISMILFCVYFYVNHLAQIRSVYSEAAGLWWHFRFLSILEMVANLILNFLLGNLMGIDGILIATIITAFLCSFLGCTIITYKELFKQSSIKYFGSNVLYFLVTIGGCLIVDAVSQRIYVSGWISLIIKGIVCAGIAIVYLGLIYCLIKPTRNELKALLYRVRNRVI